MFLFEFLIDKKIYFSNKSPTGNRKDNNFYATIINALRAIKTLDFLAKRYQYFKIYLPVYFITEPVNYVIK